jgi:hypothetical protein
LVVLYVVPHHIIPNIFSPLSHLYAVTGPGEALVKTSGQAQVWLNVNRMLEAGGIRAKYYACKEKPGRKKYKPQRPGQSGERMSGYEKNTPALWRGLRYITLFQIGKQRFCQHTIGRS